MRTINQQKVTIVKRKMKSIDNGAKKEKEKKT